MGKKSRSGSGIRYEQPGSYFLGLRNHFFGLIYLNSLMRIRDPEWKKVGSGIRGPGKTSRICNTVKLRLDQRLALGSFQDFYCSSIEQVVLT
jgi:hypothetical protein